jgi:MerR family transcriptional regulator, repressor of the yfmOP operon
MKDDDGALFRVEMTDAALDLVSVGGSRLRVRHRQGMDLRELDLDTPALGGPELIAAGVEEEPMQPGLEAIGIAQRREVPPASDERLLDGVLRAVGIPQDEPSRGVEPTDRGACQQRKGVMIASPCSFHEVSLHVVLGSARPFWSRLECIGGSSTPIVPESGHNDLHVNVKVVLSSGAMASTIRPTPAGTADPATSPPRADADAPLLRIQEVAAETGLTPRSIRYYEEMRLLEPAARSEGAYRLFDASDLERLRFIKELRDEAGFSLAQIGQLLEDEAARERNRERFRASHDPTERRALILDARERVERQIETLEAKAVRLAEMIEAARDRRTHLDQHLAELDGGPDPHPERRGPAR